MCALPLCGKASCLLSKSIKDSEKSDHPHVTDEEEEAQREHIIQVLNHCVTLPPAEHLLSARLLENIGV